MFVLHQFFYAISVILNYLISIYIWIIIIYAVLSWFNISRYHPVMRILEALVMPIFRPIRRIFRPFVGPIDLTPVIAIIILWFLQLFLVPILARIGYSVY